MNTIINFLSNRVLGPVWGFLDGKKTALTGGVSILTGVAGLAAEIVPLVAAHNTAGLLDLAKHIPTDPSYLLFLAGLGALGIGGKLQKIADASVPVAPTAEVK